MKQKLLAIAVAGLSGTALAQSTVTITGLFDTGVQMFKTESAGVTTKTNRWGSSSNTGTTNLTFLVDEALGDNMKAGLFLETDPTAGTANAAASMWNSQNYLYLSGGFGKVSLGYMNNFANTAATTAQPFGTAMGGGYTSAFGRLNGVSVIGAPANVAVATAVTAGAFAGARDIRANNSIKWDSPSFSGFTAGLIYRSPNSGSGNAAADADGQTQVGLAYNNGPLNIAYAHSNILSNVASLNKGVTTHNLLGANYKFGTVTLYGGWTSSKSTGVNGAAAGLATSSVDARSWNVALKWQATPSLAIAANVLRSDDKLVADQDRSLNALGLDYAMSKRTTAYARWEGGDNDKSAVTGSAGGKFNRTAFGLKHSF